MLNLEDLLPGGKRKIFDISHAAEVINNAQGDPGQSQADIIVTASPPPEPQPEAPLQINPVPLDALIAKPEDIQRMQPLEGLPKHKGMFGVKGTFRDILGLIGDSLLVGSGGKAIYAPQRQQERMSDALVGYGSGKEKDAIARMMQLDPETGIKMYNDWQARLAAKAKEDIDNKRLDAQLAKQDRSNQLAKLKVASGMAAKATPEQRLILKAWVADPNATVEDLPDELLPYANYAPAQQDTTAERARHNRVTEQQGQQNADSRRISATKPSAGRAQPNPTDASLAAPLIGKMNRVGWKGLSPNEQEVLKSLGRSPDRGGKKSRFGGTPPPPKKGGSPTRSTGGWGKMTVK